MARTAGLIIIGNEILSGKVQDINSPYLCEQLRELGVEVRRIVVLPDELDIVAQHARDFSEHHDYVFTTGGVGPTHDDITIEAIAQAFGRNVVRHPDLEALIRGFYKQESVDANLRMANVPEGADLIDDEGLVFPLLAYRNIYIFPGVPAIFRKKFDIIKERFRDSPFYLRRVFLREGEGIVAGYLNDLLSAYPDVMLGSYPAFDDPDYAVQITLESKDHHYLDRAYSQFVGQLPPHFIVRVEEG